METAQDCPGPAGPPKAHLGDVRVQAGLVPNGARVGVDLRRVVLVLQEEAHHEQRDGRRAAVVGAADRAYGMGD